MHLILKIVGSRRFRGWGRISRLRTTLVVILSTIGIGGATPLLLSTTHPFDLQSSPAGEVETASPLSQPTPTAELIQTQPPMPVVVRRPTFIPTATVRAVAVAPSPTGPKSSATAVSPLSTPTPESMSPTATIEVLPQSAPVGVGHVGNTGGAGTYLRHSALHGDQWLKLPDNTPLFLLGSGAEREDEIWLWVRDPHGNVGWVQSRYVIRKSASRLEW